jgi:CMP-N-acetylneuraminic acid synthetase
MDYLKARELIFRGLNNMDEYFSIIPARGGSKRLPHKNILLLNNKPLIWYTIEASLKSKYIKETIVSTDSIEIINSIKSFDIKVIKRPKKLATDTAKTSDVIMHVLKNISTYPSYIVLLQPTSPLRTSTHIDAAIDFLKNKNADAVVSVCETDHNPLWCNTLPTDLSMKNFLIEEIRNKRSQELQKYYRINGAIYICKTTRFLEEKTLFLKDNIFAYIMKKEDSVDIDEKIDLIMAETLLKLNFKGKNN